MIVESIHSLYLQAECAKGQYTSRALPSLGYIAQIVSPPKNANRRRHEFCYEVSPHVWDLFELSDCYQS